jgi:hypothetical protein
MLAVGSRELPGGELKRATVPVVVPLELLAANVGCAPALTTSLQISSRWFAVAKALLPPIDNITVGGWGCVVVVFTDRIARTPGDFEVNV